MKATVRTVSRTVGLFLWSRYNADEYVERYLHVPYTFHVLVFIQHSSEFAFVEFGGLQPPEWLSALTNSNDFQMVCVYGMIWE
jgi:hypothetical protein